MRVFARGSYEGDAAMKKLGWVSGWALSGILVGVLIVMFFETIRLENKVARVQTQRDDNLARAEMLYGYADTILKMGESCQSVLQRCVADWPENVLLHFPEKKRKKKKVR